MSLPPPSADQPYMIVSALEAGLITLPARLYVSEPSSPTEAHTCPSLAFFLGHSKTNAHLVFDLGLRKDISSYPPRVRTRIRDQLPVEVPQDVVESLEKGGIHPADVQTVVLSHLHFDHVGDSTPFTNATFVIGEASRSLLDNGYPTNPASRILTNSVPRNRTRFITSSEFKEAIGGFPNAYDYFGDGSLYLIDAPGHLEGHVNLLARTSPDGAWIFLGGDTCHDLRLLTGEKEIFYKVDEHGELTDCAHVNKDQAEEHIRRVGTLKKLKEVHVLIAHDWEWYEANKGGDAFLPGTIPPVEL